jgi:hypothetical protein
MSGIAVAFFLYAYSAFVVRDVLTVVVLPLLWVGLLVLGCRWFMTHPYRLLLLPVVAVATWFVAMLS